MARQNVTSGYPYEESYGYSRAVRVGNLVCVSGTTARPPHLAGDAYDQSIAVLDLIRLALAEAGASLKHVVRTVVYVTNMDNADQVARAHREAFGSIRPASTLVEVRALTPSEALVEFEITAVIDE